MKIQLEVVIESTERCSPRSQSSEFVDALGRHDRAKLEAVIERSWRYTWWP
jgi:hypothetical protein